MGIEHPRHAGRRLGGKVHRFWEKAFDPCPPSILGLIAVQLSNFITAPWILVNLHDHMNGHEKFQELTLSKTVFKLTPVDCECCAWQPPNTTSYPL
jgi:hypothetical protein